MASTKKPSPPLLFLPFFFFFFFFFLFSAFPTPATSISTTSLDSLLSLLRSRSHTLFANAIATSDLLFDLLSLPSLTLFAPPNPSLFALDMTLTPPFYLSTLRLHVTPSLILSFPNSSSSFIIHTLLPSRDLHLSIDHLTGTPLVDGVEILLPPLYHSRNVAVYRLRSLLPSHDLFNPVPPVPSPRNHRISNNDSNNRTVNFSPVLNRTVSPPVTVNITVLGPPPVNFTTIAPPVPANDAVLAPPPLNITIAFPSPKITTTTTTTPSNLTNSTGVPPVPINRSLTPVPENHTVLAPHSYSPAESPKNLEVWQAIPLTPVPENHTLLAPHSYTPAESPRNLEFWQAIGDYAGTSVTEKNGEHNVPAIEMSGTVEKCGPFDEETMQCSVRDVENGLGHVSKIDDYVVRHHMTDYTL